MFDRKRPVEDQELWLKEHFRTDAAGAEFTLPWAIDTLFRSVAALKTQFSAAELKTVIEAHKDAVPSTPRLRLSHLLIQVTERCERDAVHERHGASLAQLQSRLRQLDDRQAAVFVIWASAFWRGQNTSPEALEKYIAAKA